MKQTIYRIVTLVWLCCAILSTILTSAPPTALAEVDEPTDTPAKFIGETLNVWSLDSGRLYWGLNCLGGELREAGYLKRRLVNGNANTLITNVSANKCVTFRNLTSDSEGVYYYNLDDGQIERRFAFAPYDPATPLKTLNPGPISTIPLATDVNFVYWANPNNTIVRVGKDGNGFVTVANTASGLSDFIVVDSALYWLDSQGLWVTSTTCRALPCDKSQRLAFNATGDHGLLFRSDGFLKFEFDYIQTSSSDSIHRIKCSISLTGGPISCNDSTLYTVPTPDWTIGDLVSDQNNLYWTESLSDGFNQVNGRLRRKPLNDGTAVAIIDNMNDLSAQLRLASDRLYFSRSTPANVGIWRIGTDATPLVYDFKADGWEVTQAIQNLANDVPLAANKAAFVRVYGKALSGPDAKAVQVHLVGMRNGIPLPDSPLLPTKFSRKLKSGGTYDRANLKDSWNFRLPDDWTDPGLIQLQAVVDPNFNYDDSNRNNNSLAKVFNFEYQPPVCIVAPPVSTNNPYPSTSSKNFKEMVRRFEQLWPVTDAWVFDQSEPFKELEVCWWGPVAYPCHGDYELDDQSDISDNDRLMLDIIFRYAFTDFPNKCDPVGAPKHMMAMVHASADTTKSTPEGEFTTGGFASFHVEASWVKSPKNTTEPFPSGWNEMDEAKTMAQELTHNFDRGHADCGSPDSVDTNYPYPGCQISNVGAASYYGFDLVNKTAITPTQASDFMSYSPDAGEAPDWEGKWVSDYTWRGLFQGMLAASTVSSASSAAHAPTINAPTIGNAGNTVYINGIVEETSQKAEIGYAVVLPNAALSAGMRARLQALQTKATATVNAAHADHGAAPQANYHIRLVDAANNLLSDIPVTLLPADDHSESKALAYLTASFPAPAGQVAKFELLADSTVLDSVSAGGGLPIVALQQPVAGAMLDKEVTLQWTASDPDAADKLLFTLQYSYDQRTHWESLVANYPSNPTGAYTLTLTDASALAGSNGQNALIRVIASDGYNTAIATSQPFAIFNRAPEPFISQPTSEQWFAAGESVGLHGDADDVEDGGLSGDLLQWQIDGELVGKGRDLEVAGLAPGAHAVALQATDSVSATATATATLQVATLSIPLAGAPTMDGFCEDSSYENGVTLNLKPYGNGVQATVQLVRSSTDLWACFTGMKLQGGDNPSDFAGLRIDVNNSRDALAQSGDFGFFAGENGDLFTRAGNGSGGFAEAGPASLQAQVAQGATSWNAELQIDADSIGGWQHLAGLAVGHYNVASATDVYQWPYAAVVNKPNSWATSAFGDMAMLTRLEPASATVGDAAFTLAIEGSGFISGTKALWGGVELPTTLIDGEHLAVQVAANQLTNAGTIAITAKSGDIVVSNPLHFTVMNALPTLTSLTPMSTTAQSNGLLLTVQGSNFAPGSTILWNSQSLATTFVNSTQLTTQLDASLLAQGKEVGIAVLNADGEVSGHLPFVIQPFGSQANPQQGQVYLPLVNR